jgi:glycine C-acetyltransferase
MTDLYSKFIPERTPLRMLTIPHGPLGTTLYEFAEKYFLFPCIEGELGSKMMFNGTEKIIWSINDYLGLGNCDELKPLETEIMLRNGISLPMGARMFSGDTPVQHDLEAELAEYTQKESALLFNYGYQGMSSMIDSLLDFKDIVLYDSQSHACILDGVRLHIGKRLSFVHNDINNLKTLLGRAVKMAEKSGGGILVITEGVFGMAGEQGILKEIVELKKEFPFRLLVDDAHGFGVMGEHGAGTGEAQSAQHGIDLYFGTFAKAFASIGAFVAGDRHAIDFIRFGIRSQMFAKTLPGVFTETNLLRLRYARQHPELLQKLWGNVKMLQEGLKKIGFNLGNTNTQVTPIILTCSVDEGTKMMIDLRETYNVFCSGALYPVVPMGIFLLRLIPTASHSEEHIKETLDAFDSVKQKLDSGYYLQPLPESVMEKLTPFKKDPE